MSEPTLNDYREALRLCVASLDNLLPNVARIPADIGLLNDALVAARPLLKAEPNADRADSIREAMTAAGICPDCLQIPEMDEEGPFSHCRCGTGEDYAKRPLQRLQLLDRKEKM